MVYGLNAWQVSELAKMWLRGKTSVEDLSDREFEDVWRDGALSLADFGDAVEKLFQDFWDVEEGGLK